MMFSKKLANFDFPVPTDFTRVFTTHDMLSLDLSFLSFSPPFSFPFPFFSRPSFRPTASGLSRRPRSARSTPRAGEKPPETEPETEPAAEYGFVGETRAEEGAVGVM